MVFLFGLISWLLKLNHREVLLANIIAMRFGGIHLGQRGDYYTTMTMSPSEGRTWQHPPTIMY